MRGSIPFFPIDKQLTRGRLTAGAEVHIIAAHPFPTDLGAAPGTGFSVTVPDTHMVAHFDVDRLAGIADFPGPPGHYPAYCREQVFDLCRAQSGDDRLRVNAGFEENLICIRIPDAAEDRVIVDHDPHLFAPMMFDKGCKRFKLKSWTEDVDPLACIRRYRGEITGCDQIDLCHLLIITQVESISPGKVERRTKISRSLFPELLMVQSA